jgi:hypothetical protein
MPGASGRYGLWNARADERNNQVVLIAADGLRTAEYCTSVLNEPRVTSASPRQLLCPFAVLAVGTCGGRATPRVAKKQAQ